MSRSGRTSESKTVKSKCKIKIKLQEMLSLLICTCATPHTDYTIVMTVKDLYDISDFQFILIF